jgi:hypothetical protein
MLDPTASVTMGDEYPNYVPDSVDRAIVYDDKQPFTHFDATAGDTRDSMRVQGADYYEAPALDHYDPGYSHMQVPPWYLNSRYIQDDINWLLDRNPVQASGAIQPENLGNGHEAVYAGSPANETNVIDIGVERTDGNIHGYISIIGVGGVDVRIGPDGIYASGGTLGTAGTVAVGPDGVTISAGATVFIGGIPIPVNATVIAEGEGVTIEGGIGGVLEAEVSMTEGGSISLGGKKIIGW